MAIGGAVPAARSRGPSRIPCWWFWSSWSASSSRGSTGRVIRRSSATRAGVGTRLPL